MASSIGTSLLTTAVKRRQQSVLFQGIRRFFLAVFCLTVAGCVANSTLPSQNISTLLTPDAKQKAPTESATANLAPKESSNGGKELSPAIKNALVPEDSAKPAEKATDLVTKKPTAPSAPTVAKVKPATASAAQTKVALAKPSAKPKPAKKSKSLFSALAKTNDAANSRVKNRPRVKVKLRKGKKGLPGVRRNLFGIDTNETEEFDEPARVASAPNLARKGRHGLLLQRAGVQVGCFPPKLVRILKKAERRFRTKVIVSSGYRSRAYNRRVGGARKSTHVRCMAADIQLKGVSKWRLAKYLRSIPGRGGVGTYCHTKSVHIDIGTKRAWHHCKRRRRSPRKKR